MNEAEIRMQAQMYALVADMHSVVARMEGMKAYNEHRKNCGDAVGYCEEAFNEVQTVLESLSRKLREDI